MTALRQLGAHERVVGFVEYIVEAKRALLLLELVPGGDLENLANSHPDGVDEAAVHGIALDLLSALRYCHARGVAHRDVKLANCLVAVDGSLRLADFGHAATWQVDAPAADLTAFTTAPPLHDKVGTKSFCAPEIIACGAEGYRGPPADVWSAGVCLFALLSGRLPFAIADEGADWRFAQVLPFHRLPSDCNTFHPTFHGLP